MDGWGMGLLVLLVSNYSQWGLRKEPVDMVIERCMDVSFLKKKKEEQFRSSHTVKPKDMIFYYYFLLFTLAV